MEENQAFETDLIHAIFKLVWSRRALGLKYDAVFVHLASSSCSSLLHVDFVCLIPERQLLEGTEALDGEVGAGTLKKNRPTSANANALKLSCELLRNFVTEAVQRSATIAEAEGSDKIEATHLERILPQLLLDF
ncbi:LOW QUALITY PROTEIN: protein MHF2 homolog [Argentina anserina]|uniref:LOW QUALITY PROTEIN: protein MHF2 homolog n=1 Tax=Argentina anserina TaxID=57926 RepID=UPI0021768B7A|nr:LOW QUALITY PROTEIN: protein MHF2 homolog [Potentilla anserina]